jgi:hypothetical protein
MKTFAVYDKDGNIKKVISTTRKDLILINIPEGHTHMEVDHNVKTNTHKIQDGVVIKEKRKVEGKRLRRFNLKGVEKNG